MSFLYGFPEVAYELKDEPPGFGSENLPEGIFVDSLVSNAIEKLVNGSDAEQRSEIESVEGFAGTLVRRLSCTFCQMFYSSVIKKMKLRFGFTRRNSERDSMRIVVRTSQRDRQ